MLDHSPPRETDFGRTQSPSSMKGKRTMDRWIKIGQIGHKGIGGDNIGLIGTPLI